MQENQKKIQSRVNYKDGLSKSKFKITSYLTLKIKKKRTRFLGGKQKRMLRNMPKKTQS